MTVEARSPKVGSQLPYPDRFYAAVDFVNNMPAGTQPLAEEVQLLLYALHQQATLGPCKDGKPWGWNVVESAKWKSWAELGSMPTMEAMRLYVRALEEEVHDWYALGKANKKAAIAAGAAGAAGASSPEVPISAPQKQPAAPASPAPSPSPSLVAPAAPAQLLPAGFNPLEGRWSTLEVGEGGSRPVPRYEQGAAIIGSSLFVVGGHYGGRYLNDVWSFDIGRRKWTALAATKVSGASDSEEPAAPPPCAGHSLVPLPSGSLLVLGGHSKAKGQLSMAARLLDIKTMEWQQVEMTGDALPAPRGGHSATLLGSQVLVLGGEDAGRKALGDLWALDTASMAWRQLHTSGKGPSPRSAHAAAAFDKYLVVFGGGSVATCFSDLHVLDLETLAWSSPRQEGAAPSARAGHSGALLGTIWYIVGGGNNVRGCTDMLALDLSRLSEGVATWAVVGQIPSKSPLSSEGISLLPVPALRSLVAFGGYNGKYHNTVSAFEVGVKPPAQEQQQQQLRPTDEAPPATRSGSRNAEPPAPSPFGRSAAAAPAALPGEAGAKLREQLEAARREAEGAVRAAAAAQEGAAHELALMRKELASTQAALAESERARDVLGEKLQEEQSRALKLEGELAEARARLAAAEALQRELAKERKLAEELESKKSGGIWGYISGQ